LTPERLDGNLGQWHIANAVRRLRFRNVHQSVFEIDLFLLHRKEFFFVTQPHFRQDYNDVPEVAGRDHLDLCLLGRRHVVRLPGGLPELWAQAGFEGS
jgi:hypothetical protein